MLSLRYRSNSRLFTCVIITPYSIGVSVIQSQKWNSDIHFYSIKINLINKE